ncbi:unnamed protein product [Amoebophrya sp. A25]|nr:unnamed protein product [Amoebophrya sp. A25]|eukprot:GSA25T00015440001.1
MLSLLCLVLLRTLAQGSKPASHKGGNKGKGGKGGDHVLKDGDKIRLGTIDVGSGDETLVEDSVAVGAPSGAEVQRETKTAARTYYDQEETLVSEEPPEQGPEEWHDFATVIVSSPQSRPLRRVEIMEETMKTLAERTPKHLVHLCFDGNTIDRVRTISYVHIHPELANNATLRQEKTLWQLKLMSDELADAEERYLSLTRSGNPNFFANYVPIRNGTTMMAGAHLDSRCRKPFNNTIYRDFKRRAKNSARRIFQKGWWARAEADEAAFTASRTSSTPSRTNDSALTRTSSSRSSLSFAPLAHRRSSSVWNPFREDAISLRSLKRRGLRSTFFSDVPNLRMVELNKRSCLGGVLESCISALPPRIKLVHVVQADMPFLRRFDFSGVVSLMRASRQIRDQAVASTKAKVQERLEWNAKNRKLLAATRKALRKAKKVVVGAGGKKGADAVVSEDEGDVVVGLGKVKTPGGTGTPVNASSTTRISTSGASSGRDNINTTSSSQKGLGRPGVAEEEDLQQESDGAQLNPLHPKPVRPLIWDLQRTLEKIPNIEAVHYAHGLNWMHDSWGVQVCHAFLPTYVGEKLIGFYYHARDGGGGVKVNGNKVTTSSRSSSSSSAAASTNIDYIGASGSTSTRASASTTSSETKAQDGRVTVSLTRSSVFSDQSHIVQRDFYDRFIWPTVRHTFGGFGVFPEDQITCVVNKSYGIWHVGDLWDGDYAAHLSPGEDWRQEAARDRYLSADDDPLCTALRKRKLTKERLLLGEEDGLHGDNGTNPDEVPPDFWQKGLPELGYTHPVTKERVPLGQIKAFSIDACWKRKAAREASPALPVPVQSVEYASSRTSGFSTAASALESEVPGSGVKETNVVADKNRAKGSTERPKDKEGATQGTTATIAVPSSHLSSFSSSTSSKNSCLGIHPNFYSKAKGDTFMLHETEHNVTHPKYPMGADYDYFWQKWTCLFCDVVDGYRKPSYVSLNRIEPPYATTGHRASSTLPKIE